MKLERDHMIRTRFEWIEVGLHMSVKKLDPGGVSFLYIISMFRQVCVLFCCVKEGRGVQMRLYINYFL
jgi:hypothetical protein